jgi:hypothetical protein
MTYEGWKPKPYHWTIVVDAGVDCPSCESAMETILMFLPVSGKVGGNSRRELEGKGFDYWLDKATTIVDACSGCGYKLPHDHG